MATCTQCGNEVSVFDKDMFTGTCGNCRKIGARPATLGFGTLVLIAFFVAIAMSSTMSGVTSSVTELGRDVNQLKKLVDEQTAEIHALRAAMDPTEPVKARSARNLPR